MIRYRLVFDTLMIDWVGLDLQVHFMLDLFGSKRFEIYARFMSFFEVLKLESNIEIVVEF